jgi:hypothetical protein
MTSPSAAPCSPECSRSGCSSGCCRAARCNAALIATIGVDIVGPVVVAATVLPAGDWIPSPARASHRYGTPGVAAALPVWLALFARLFVFGQVLNAMPVGRGAAPVRRQQALLAGQPRAPMPLPISTAPMTSKRIAMTVALLCSSQVRTFVSTGAMRSFAVR